MHTFVQFHHQKKSGYVCAPWSGVLVLGLALAAPAAYAGMGAGTGGGGSSAGAGAGGGGAGAAAGTAGGGGGGGTVHRPNGQTELTTCRPGMVWDSKSKVPGQAQRGAASARADRIRVCARQGAVSSAMSH